MLIRTGAFVVDQRLQTCRLMSSRKLLIMVRPERFELPTLWFEAKCSIQLSYGRGKQGSAVAKNSELFGRWQLCCGDRLWGRRRGRGREHWHGLHDVEPGPT
jgi:hypothetical protein